jgi:hypothetical protein
MSNGNIFFSVNLSEFFYDLWLKDLWFKEEWHIKIWKDVYKAAFDIFMNNDYKKSALLNFLKF